MPYIQLNEPFDPFTVVAWKGETLAAPSEGWQEGFYYLYETAEEENGTLFIDWYDGPYETLERCVLGVLKKTMELDFTTESYKIQKSIRDEFPRLYALWSKEQKRQKMLYGSWDDYVKTPPKGKTPLKSMLTVESFASFFDEVEFSIPTAGVLIDELAREKDKEKAYKKAVKIPLAQRMEEEL